MNLEQIGFYTLSESRAESATSYTALQRCELILTGRCNFHCPYCRSVGGADLPIEQAARTVSAWCAEGLKNIRFSGGEPMLYKGLPHLVQLAKLGGVKRIAVSTNGSLPFNKYRELIFLGVSDFSISLDACCAEDGDKMAGGVKGAWKQVVQNIRYLSSIVYTTVGVVLTDDNMESVNDTIKFAASLGVSDIRIIPAAQQSDHLHNVQVDQELLDRHPILKYRIENIKAGRPVRGISRNDTNKCGLILDDMAVMGDKHYPCIIYMREGGAPIGPVDRHMRERRESWWLDHDTHHDPICQKNCLDVCVDYNNKHAAACRKRALQLEPVACGNACGPAKCSQAWRDRPISIAALRSGLVSSAAHSMQAKA